MKQFSILLLGVFFLSLQISCSEFIEPSIKGKDLILNSPADRAQSNRYSQSFWWEKVEHARAYHLQVVSPSFDSVGYLALDTVIKTNTFNFTFEPGEYQWRVRAENSGSETAYFTRTFTIYPSSITSQQVQLISPIGNSVSNQSDLLVKWYNLYGATKYRLQVDTTDFQDETKMVYNSTTTGTELNIPLSLERTYKWRLRAESDSLQSKWSGTYTFTYDNTAPAKVTVISPDNNSSIAKPVQLRWNAVAGAKKYQVILYKNGSASPYDSSFPVTVTGTSYSLNKGEQGEILQWQVRAIDEAGNIGEYSTSRSFTVQ